MLLENRIQFLCAEVKKLKIRFNGISIELGGCYFCWNGQ
ncbi:MAG: hypothetical protein Hyperionvirus2_144 [Hyperionvirus sp.]|uniref:Uncharacterized protein n=1 Tax=Hyperionvirus sp. TaxID=2487770 RepID=A0A3G5A695_9VIRU|nr:MAG: hypothetical protein Hyperionvirus2_144 [Hyperionvirus sp.]